MQSASYTYTSLETSSLVTAWSTAVILLYAHVFVLFGLLIHVSVSSAFSVVHGIWNLIVSVLDHCLFQEI